MKKISAMTIGALLSLVAGCASDQRCVIATGNEDARLYEHGHRLGSGKLAHVTLNAGSDHRVIVEADGYEPQDVVFVSHTDVPWSRLIFPLLLCPPVILAVPCLALAGFYDTLDPRAASVVLTPK